MEKKGTNKQTANGQVLLNLSYVAWSVQKAGSGRQTGDDQGQESPHRASTGSARACRSREAQEAGVAAGLTTKAPEGDPIAASAHPGRDGKV